MCVTTGMGEAKNRAFCGVTFAPPVSSVSRAAPAITGMRLRTIKATGTAHFVRRFRICGGVFLDVMTLPAFWMDNGR